MHIGPERALRVALLRACSNVVVTENPVQNVTFPSNGGTAHGYLAVPESGSGPGLVIIQEWWGLTTHIKDVTDRFAAEGFVALAPDLFGGATTHDSDEAGTLMSERRSTRRPRTSPGPSTSCSGTRPSRRRRSAPSGSAWAAGS